MILRTFPSVIAGALLMLGQFVSAALAEDCELALVLAMDVSKSMDSTDFDLQFQGTAAALRDPAVQAAILAQRSGVAMTAFEWSGQFHQSVIADWTMLRTIADIEDVATLLEGHSRGGIGQHTGTGAALAYSFDSLAGGPACNRSVIDVSSDGYSTDGPTPQEFYVTEPPENVTVNALVIGGKSRPMLLDYFIAEVVHGPDSFEIATFSFEDYPRAILDKLLRELMPATIVADAGLH